VLEVHCSCFEKNGQREVDIGNGEKEQLCLLPSLVLGVKCYVAIYDVIMVL
jgi:hypothetical protein